MQKIISNNKKFICLECQNENEVEAYEIGDVIECDFCGIEFEVTDKNDSGEYILQIIEDEK